MRPRQDGHGYEHERDMDERIAGITGSKNQTNMQQQNERNVKRETSQNGEKPDNVGTNSGSIKRWFSSDYWIRDGVDGTGWGKNWIMYCALRRRSAECRSVKREDIKREATQETPTTPEGQAQAQRGTADTPGEQPRRDREETTATQPVRITRRPRGGAGEDRETARPAAERTRTNDVEEAGEHHERRNASSGTERHERRAIIRTGILVRRSTFREWLKDKIGENRIGECIIRRWRTSCTFDVRYTQAIGERRLRKAVMREGWTWSKYKEERRRRSTRQQPQRNTRQTRPSSQGSETQSRTPRTNGDTVDRRQQGHGKFLLSWNICGWRGKQYEVQEAVKKWKPIVVCVQETLVGDGDWKPRIPGYNAIHDDAKGTHDRGLLLAIRNDRSSVEIAGVQGALKAAKIFNMRTDEERVYWTVASVYNTCTSKAAIRDWMNRRDQTEPAVIAGDWNMAPHTTANYLRGAPGWHIMPFRGSDVTFPRKRTRIDRVIVNTEALRRLGHAKVWRKRDASDHWPVLAATNTFFRPTPPETRWTIRRDMLGEKYDEITQTEVFQQLADEIEHRNAYAAAELTRRNSFAALGELPDETEIYSRTLQGINDQLDALNIRKQTKSFKAKLSITNTLARAIAKRGELARRARENPESETAQAEYKHYKRVVRRKIRKHGRKQYSKWVTRGCEAMAAGQSKKTWDWLRATTGARRAGNLIGGPVRANDGTTILYQPEEIKSRWSSHFADLATGDGLDNLSREEWEARLQSPERTENTIDVLNLDITWEEITAALRKGGRNKAPGPDDIPMEFWKLATNEEDEPTTPLGKLTYSLVRDMFRRGVPREWSNAKIIALLKPGGNADDPHTYRGISLLATISKLVTSIVATRMLAAAESNTLLGPEQFGFRQRQQATALFLASHEICARRKQQGKDTYLAFMDLRKAYDCVPINALLVKLDRMGVRGRMWDFIAKLYRTSTATVITSFGPSPEFTLKRGVRQGCPLSPILFNLYISDIIANQRIEGVPWGEARIKGGMFADDLLVFAETEGQMQRTMNELENWTRVNGMSFNVAKCGLMKVKKKQIETNPSPGNTQPAQTQTHTTAQTDTPTQAIAERRETTHPRQADSDFEDFHEDERTTYVRLRQRRVYAEERRRRNNDNGNRTAGQSPAPETQHGNGNGNRSGSRGNRGNGTAQHAQTSHGDSRAHGLGSHTTRTNTGGSGTRGTAIHGQTTRGETHLPDQGPHTDRVGANGNANDYRGYDDPATRGETQAHAHGPNRNRSDPTGHRNGERGRNERTTHGETQYHDTDTRTGGNGTPRCLLNGTEIPVVTEYKYMGLLFRDDLTMDDILRTIAKKIDNIEKSLRMFICSQAIPVAIRLTLVRAKLLGIASYGGEFLGGLAAVKTAKIQTAFNRAVRRLVGNMSKNTAVPVGTALREFNLPMLRTRWIDQQLRAEERWSETHTIIAPVINAPQVGMYWTWKRRCKALKRKIPSWNSDLPRETRFELITNAWRTQYNTSNAWKKYAKNKLGETTAYLRTANQCGAQMANGFKWLLRARIGAIWDKRRARGARLLQGDTPRSCFGCNATDETLNAQGHLEHWVITCPRTRIYRTKYARKYRRALTAIETTTSPRRKVKLIKKLWSRLLGKARRGEPAEEGWATGPHATKREALRSDCAKSARWLGATIPRYQKELWDWRIPDLRVENYNYRR
jgi:exonuclease III